MSVSATPVVVRVLSAVTPAADRGMIGGRIRVMIVVMLLAVIPATSGCTDGATSGQQAAPSVPSATTAPTAPTASATVVLDPTFAGDAFDATCAVLDESRATDPVQAVGEVFEALAAIGGEDAAATTLRTAVDDRCPEWSDAVDEALAG